LYLCNIIKNKTDENEQMLFLPDGMPRFGYDGLWWKEKE
jgi:hypothetical protein